MIIESRNRAITKLVIAGVSWSSCRQIFYGEIVNEKASANVALRFLTKDLNRSQLNACRKLKAHSEVNASFFREVINCAVEFAAVESLKKKNYWGVKRRLGRCVWSIFWRCKHVKLS